MFWAWNGKGNVVCLVRSTYKILRHVINEKDAQLLMKFWKTKGHE